MEKCILLIDDDEDEIEIFNDALSKLSLDFPCSQVTSTEDAIAWVKDTTPAFIFIDLNMPKLNGIDCLKELKKIKELQDTEFIIYSNFIDDSLNKEARDAGATACIKKPNLTSTLAQRLKEILLMKKSSI